MTIYSSKCLFRGLFYLNTPSATKTLVLTFDNPARLEMPTNKPTQHFCLERKINIGFKPAHWLVGRVFANGLGDLGSIPGLVIPKTLKMVLDASLLNTQQYKVCIKGKVEQSRERSSALPYTSVYYLLKREPSSRPRLRSQALLYIYIYIYIAFVLYVFSVLHSIISHVSYVWI